MAKKKIEGKTPLDMYNWIYYKILYTLGNWCGLHFMKIGFRPHLRTYCQLFSIFLFLVFFVAMIGNRDFTIVVQCGCCLNICFQGIVKYATVMIYYKELYENARKIGKIYKSNQIRGTPNYLVLERWGAYGLIMCKFFLTLCASLGIIIFASPILFYIIYGKSYEPMVPLLLPGVNEKEQLGYSIQTGYHILMLSQGMFGTAGSDIKMISFILHMWPMCLIFTNMVTDMNKALKDPANRNSLELQRFVRNMIMVHQEIFIYKGDISNMYYLQCSMEVFSNATAMICCVFCILTLNWPQVYFITFLNFSKLLAYCFLGTIAELASDHILQNLLNSDYYLLPLKQQRFIQLMILMAQHPTVLMAGSKNLNLSLFIDIMKSVYSVAMILLETVN